MNVNKKFDRWRQWGKEKMGQEAKSTATEEFKQLEAEMNGRAESLEKLHSAMNSYVKSLSTRAAGEGKDKSTAMVYLGATMARHGEGFGENNAFSECISSFGRTNERIARVQESYATSITDGWLQTLERSLAQMKDYQNARRKLENRRLAYDTSMVKLQKARRDDFKVEEELRSQKAKYEESIDDVYRRMEDIIDADKENSSELHQFLEAELDYHDRCRDALLKLKRNWPVVTEPSLEDHQQQRPYASHRQVSTNVEEDDELPMPRLPTRPSRANSDSNSSRSASGLTSSAFYVSSRPQPPRMLTDPNSIRTQQRQLKTTLPSTRFQTTINDEDDCPPSESPEAYSHEDEQRSSSPSTTSYSASTSHSHPLTRNESWSTMSSYGRDRAGSGGIGARDASSPLSKKIAPPPPPPSRSTKPKPPPPPPIKRSALSQSAVPQY